MTLQKCGRRKFAKIIMCLDLGPVHEKGLKVKMLFFLSDQTTKTKVKLFNSNKLNLLSLRKSMNKTKCLTFLFSIMIVPDIIGGLLY